MDRQVTAIVLSTVALVPTVYGATLPPLSSVRADADGAGHVEAAEKYALVTAGILVLGIGIATRTPEVVAVGGITVFAFHVAYTNARKVRS